MIPGLAPAPDEMPPPPVVTSMASAADLLRLRGKRRAKDDIAPGFEFNDKPQAQGAATAEQEGE
jgi:hypothetical protein